MNFKKYNKLYEQQEKSYFHEIEAREKINSRLGVPLSILTSLIAVYALILTQAKTTIISDSCMWGATERFFFLGLFASGCLIIYACYLFKITWTGHVYRYTPSERQIVDYWRELEETYKEYPQKNDLVEAHFCEFYCESLVNCATQNRNNNVLRSADIHKASTVLFYTVIIVTITYLIFCYGLNAPALPITKV
jgi:hypothetical protein